MVQYQILLPPEEHAMTDAVRFYWQKGEAELPLDAIPEGERSPLHLRRRVVQAHAPAVVEQLAAGHFIAAAWSADGDLHMILCHPNLAKVPSDAVLVNSSALPKLIVKFGKWEEAPTVAGLFLRAFGDGAAKVEECAAAQRDLAAWLASRSQPKMAAVSRYFSAFPFGVRSESLDVINIWRKILVKGERERIDRFLVETQSRFESVGWARDSERETSLNSDSSQINRFYCWLGGRGSKPEVMLCLKRATDRRVRGSTYDILDRQIGLADVAYSIQQVLREVLEPAAEASGLIVTYPHLGPISRIGENAAEAMTALAEAGDGQWPLPERAESFWRALVRTAYREEVAINPEELTAWFNASGWGDEASAELARRFYSEMALLAEYEEAGRQPA
jgi:hypothetical protein